MRRRGAEWLFSSHHICDPPGFCSPLVVRHTAPGRRMAALEPPHLRSPGLLQPAGSTPCGAGAPNGCFRATTSAIPRAFAARW